MKRLRRHAGITQPQLAAMLGVSASYIIVGVNGCGALSFQCEPRTARRRVAGALLDELSELCRAQCHLEILEACAAMCPTTMLLRKLFATMIGSEA